MAILYSSLFTGGRVTGTLWNDTIYGYWGNDELRGGRGDDVIYGAGGSD